MNGITQSVEQLLIQDCCEEFMERQARVLISCMMVKWNAVFYKKAKEMGAVDENQIIEMLRIGYKNGNINDMIDLLREDDLFKKKRVKEFIKQFK